MNDSKTHRDTSGEELTRGTLGTAWSTEMRLSAAQLHDDKDEPSWKAPHEKRGLSTAAIITIVIVVAVAVLIVFRVVGII
jgi:hypothetical protein